jgi:predicted O-methyltransferase YrrM
MGSGVLRHRFFANLAASGLEHRVDVRRDLSRRILPQLPDASYHFIYIDGSHEALDVMTDACLALPLLRRGGLLLFDDYRWSELTGHRHLPPAPAIDAFLSFAHPWVEVVHRDFQLAVRRR